jgi:hypothetical protein
MNYKIIVVAFVMLFSCQSTRSGFFDFVTYPYYLSKDALENLLNPQKNLSESPVEVAQKTIALNKEIARLQIERKLNKCLANNVSGEKNHEGFPVACKDLINEFTLLVGLDEREILRKAYTDHVIISDHEKIS